MDPLSLVVNRYTTNNLYNLNSRKLRRCIIECEIFVRPDKDILVLISEDRTDFTHCNKTVTKYRNGLHTIVFGSKVYNQINATVLKNISRYSCVDSELDNDMINYHVIGIRGASISLGSVHCCKITSIEL